MHKNGFIALCEVAGREHWCWQMVCSTCGHSSFLYGLMQLDWGRHPADDEWVPESLFLSPAKPLGDYDRPRRHLESGCERLYLICASASLFELADVCPFPDYLGYMGLVLHHLEHLEAKYLLLSKLWGGDLKEMSRDHYSCSHGSLEQPENGQLRWTHLGQFENAIGERYRRVAGERPRS